MGPIENAIDVMLRAQMAFREHGLLSQDECAVCNRILVRGVHTSDCPVDGLGKAVERLREFQKLVST